MSGSTMSEPPAPPKAARPSNAKWIAAIVVLVVIIAGLGVFAIMKAPSKTVTKIVKEPITVTYGTSAFAVAAQTANVGSPFYYQITTNGTFNWLMINWGDGDIQYMPYTGTNTLNISHTYVNPGVYAIYYEVDFNGTLVSNAASLNTVVVGYPDQAAQAAAEQHLAYGSLQPNYSAAVTSKPVITNPIWAFTPGSMAEFNVTSTTPTNSTIEVVSQNAVVYFNSVPIQNLTVLYSSGAQMTFPVVNLTNMQSGYYTVLITTYTVGVNSSGVPVTPTFSSGTYFDIPVFSNVGLYSPKVVPTGQYVRVELETGGFKTLDPAIEYDTVSNEIVMNTYLNLFAYNMTGSSPSNEFVPVLAKNLPTIANGEINSKTYYYNITLPNGKPYEVKVLPYENYTIYINNNSKWQNGTPVTAWDAYYSLVRTLLFDAGSPGTPGWIQAQFLLPGNYYVSNTFFNITTNMSYNNLTNSLTLHFQEPVPPQLFYETFGPAPGAAVVDAQWLIQHGAGITWTPAGFQAYKAEGNQGDYNTFVQYNIFADGPYELAYSVPSQEVVLTANPYYVAPNPYFPAPHIKTIFIKYVAEPSTSYLDLKSGYAQTASIPTSNYNLVEGLEKTGTVGVIPFPTLSIFWYNFNAYVNTSMLDAEIPAANLPPVLFDSLQVRQAFAYAYNYNYYLNNDVGNAIYNVTFATTYAGMLPAGMLYNQSIAQLNSTTTGVPYYDLSKAATLWENFVNSSMAHDMGISYTSGKDMYNRKPLNIPIFIFSADPVDQQGASQWATALQTFMPGVGFEVEPTAFTTLLGNMVQGQNPMPIYELGWAPDYPYPTDYLGPMALPVNSSTYPGPNDMNPYWFYGNPANPLYAYKLTEMKSQAQNLTYMLDDWNNASANPAVAEQNYHMMNEMLVNMTFYVYIEQEYGFWIYSTKTNATAYAQWEEGVSSGMSGDLYYNYLYYNT